MSGSEVRLFDPRNATHSPGDPRISILSRLFGKGGGHAQERGLFLAAFGKHPGWNDHIDDQGLETQRLIDLKSLIYVEGIGSRIDSGVWDKLEPEQSVEGFAHTFVLRSRGDWTLGRLWSSRDGKGRARYPMVVACQIVGAPLEWAAKEVFPELANVQAICERETDAAKVIASIDASRRMLREKFARVGPDWPEITLHPAVACELADRPEMGPARQGMYRLLYQIERELAEYLTPGEQGGSPSAESRPQQLRVPPCSEHSEDALTKWMQFLMLKVDVAVPMILFSPRGKPWLDVLVGEPSGSQLFCLRATPKSIPLTTDIPYTLDPAFVGAVDGWLDVCRTAPSVEVRTQGRIRRAGEAGRFG